MNTTGKFFKIWKEDKAWEKVISWDLEHFPKPWKKESWESLEEQHHQLFICKSNDEPVAFALFNLVKSDDTAHLLKIFVLPDFRGGAITVHFWQYLVDYYKNQCKQIYLEVEGDNLKAIRFYQKHGFQHLRTIKAYYSNGSDALIMTLTL